MNSGYLLMIGSGGFFLFCGLITIAILLGFKKYDWAVCAFIVTLISIALFAIAPGFGWRSSINQGIHNRQVFWQHFPEAERLLTSNDGTPTQVLIVKDNKLVFNKNYPTVYYFTWIDKKGRYHISNLIGQEGYIAYKVDRIRLDVYTENLVTTDSKND